ncbi:MAG: T9SS C-terminal target domain-containing protein [Candidatus Zixiibacteriota bacterium]
MYRKLILTVVLAVFLLPLIASAQVSEAGKPTKVINDAYVNGFTYLSRDTVWILSGLVFVEDGSVLVIEPGTIIKANPGQDVNSSALVVAKGGKIYAEGTPQNPIIFTALSDDVDNPNDIAFDETGRGLWGGVILLGRASINTSTGVGQIEGIVETEERGSYGQRPGIDDDNSGIMRYVSIRHGGTEIGAANEINGLTMGALGSGTVIEHIEVFMNKDDGFEWFGGTVNCRYLVSTMCGDDGFDYDEGFNGHGQFWFNYMSADAGNRSGEHDGGTDPEDGTPFAVPVISNATYLGTGAGSGYLDNDYVFKIRDNAGSKYYNSIFADIGDRAIDIEDLASGEDSRARLAAGDIIFQDNIWYDFGAGNTVNAITVSSQTYVRDSVFDTTGTLGLNNQLADPLLGDYGNRTNDHSLDPVPATGSPAIGSFFSALPSPGVGGTATDPWFEQVDYKGAFDPEIPVEHSWIAGWTALSFYGFLKDNGTARVYLPYTSDYGKPTALVTNAWIANANLNPPIVFNKDTVYVLDTMVFVDNGMRLLVEPGTVIKGNPGQDVNSKALIITRGGQGYFPGAHDAPIILTAASDQITTLVGDSLVYEVDDIAFDESGRGLWGGLLVLGRSYINTATGVGQIEGIVETEPRGAYGQRPAIEDDNSGVYRYISIRHGGTEIGAANEINGLTMGAVGSGTIIDHIEVFMNKDDGYEWFGGTVNCTYIISAFCGDDAFDYDEGFRGKGQFWFAYLADDAGNVCGEHDGGTDPEDGYPWALPVISNVTFIGSGASSGYLDNAYTFAIRDNAGGHYFNSIFVDMADRALNIEDLASGSDSRAMLASGVLAFKNTYWYDFGAGNTVNDITRSEQTYVRDSIFDTTGTLGFNNLIVDPQVNSYGTRQNPTGSLDPRVSTGSPAATGANDTVTCGFGRSGNVNCSASDEPDISDITRLIDFLYLSHAPLCCLAEADANNSGGDPDISDITKLIDYLYLSHAPLANVIDDPWFKDVDYHGAFDPFLNLDENGNFICDWTFLKVGGFVIP